MKLKKGSALIKVLSAAGISIGAIAAFNKISFLKGRKNEEDTNGEYYQWTYGKIYYKTAGNGKPLLLLHSLYPGCCMAEWDETVNQLSAKYKVYTIDMLGYGMSDKPKMTYTAFIYASLIKDFIENVIKSPACVLAANGSGAAAVTAAKIYQNCITKLMIVSPNGVNDDMAVNSSRIKRIIMEIPLMGTAYYNIMTSKTAISIFVKKYGFLSKEIDRSDFIKEMYHSAHSENGNARYAFASFITNYMNMDIKQYISSLNMPLCVAWGEENELNSFENMKMLRDIMPKAVYFIFEKTKIFPHIENPIEFSNCAEGFFR